VSDVVIPLSGRLDRLTALLFVVALSAGFATFGSETALNDVAHHFGHLTSVNSIQGVVGLSGSMLGLGLSVLRVASLGALPLSSLADRWGRTRVLERTLLIGLAVTAVAAASPTYWIFVACFALARPLLAAATTMVQVITVELSTTAQRMRLLAVMAAGTGIGSGLSAILHGVIRGPDSFRWLFALAIVPVVAVVPWLRTIPEPPGRGPEAPLARLGAVPREALGRLAVVAIVAFTIGVVTGPAGGFTFVYAEGVLKMRPFDVAVVVAASGLAGLVGLFLSARLAGTLGRRVTVACGVVLTAVVSTYAYSGGRDAFVVGYVLSVGAGGILAPAMTAISTEIFAHRFRATAAGWITVAGVAGAVAGFALFGYVADVFPATVATGLRGAALITFLPVLPTLLMLTRLPESRGLDLT
jgi:MFS family permease